MQSDEVLERQDRIPERRRLTGGRSSRSIKVKMRELRITKRAVNTFTPGSQRIGSPVSPLSTISEVPPPALDLTSQTPPFHQRLQNCLLQSRPRHSNHKSSCEVEVMSMSTTPRTNDAQTMYYLGVRPDGIADFDLRDLEVAYLFLILSKPSPYCISSREASPAPPKIFTTQQSLADFLVH